MKTASDAEARTRLQSHHAEMLVTLQTLRRCGGSGLFDPGRIRLPSAGVRL